MPSVTLISRLLDAADKLIEAGPSSSAFKRRAVSTAYYAVFHALARACAENLLPDAARTSGEYSRIYRALDHGPLRTAFAKSPLKDRESLKKIGDLVVRLQSERHLADYSPPSEKKFSRRQAQRLVDQARQAIEEINSLDEPDGRTLATCLLFRTRQP
jgi:uncharacterized protein (UPF0332 family)